MLLMPVTRWLLVRMYPPSSMMTPDPDPDWVCEGLAGMPRVRMVTTEGRTFATTAGTERDFSVEATSAASGISPNRRL